MPWRDPNPTLLLTETSQRLGRSGRSLHDRARARARRDGHGLPRARPKHDRLIALKVLHPELAATLGPRASSGRSAPPRAAAPAYPAAARFGGRTGSCYFVMPYVEGESLRTRITRRAAPSGSGQAVAECVDALAYAHGAGSSTATSSRTTSCSPGGTRWSPTSAWLRR